ncbi:thiamine phosphate synthase [Thermococcus sp. P6]|uniref:thiamine phosphate synthase n=1 Tax=Thermococcus sp. P6 TaxID=122420 RepID=UPI000B59A769|nr:thiamine phosphate synthase [Thermococcus sp. P6]ASJ10739.1 thiamine phosphate synthase [Thermococcus sp. P6]
MDLGERLKLYVITDRRLRDEVSTVRDALEGGATAIQMRIKDAPTREMVEVGKKLRKLTLDYDALFFVDDRVDVALAVDADGVHLGPEDMPVPLVRKIAPGLIIGASVRTPEEALRAEREGADYLGVGAVFPTSTKPDARYIGLDGLRAVLKVTRLPVVAIGGINRENVRDVVRLGVSGVAVISAVVGAPDVKRATMELKREVMG